MFLYFIYISIFLTLSSFVCNRAVDTHLRRCRTQVLNLRDLRICRAQVLLHLRRFMLRCYIYVYVYIYIDVGLRCYMYAYINVDIGFKCYIYVYFYVDVGLRQYLYTQRTVDEGKLKDTSTPSVGRKERRSPSLVLLLFIINLGSSKV